MAQLIVDSGGTKTHWAWEKDGEVKEFKTRGINPFFHGENDILDILLREVPQDMRKPGIKEIYFYGAGCSSKSRSSRVEKALKNFFHGAKIWVMHDLLGAARALSGDQKSIIAILGTGSNSCFYDGQEITAQHGGIGYILGDEGSGAQMGKKLLQQLLYEELPEELSKKVYEETNTSRDGIIEATYRQPSPNRYLASYAEFVQKNLQEKPLLAIVKDCFGEFLSRHVSKYEEKKSVKMHCVGSVAWHFREVLEESCKAHGIELGDITTEPIRGMVEYHQRGN